MGMDQKKIAVVTGGAQGIGRGIVTRLRDEGWIVVIADNDSEAVEEAVAALGGSVIGKLVDVSDEKAVHRLFSWLKATYGRLDLLVNNAAIAKAHGTPLESLALEEWQHLLNVNLTGPFLCSKYAAPLLRHPGGSIIHIASTRAVQSEPDSEAYAASKGGVVALTHAMALSLGPQIRVNCISPGWIDVSALKKGAHGISQPLSRQDHEQHPVGRVGQPQDIAATVCFLASAQAGFITGQNLVVDGGMTRKMIYVE
jgi:NAD(P)-dependent dehydrogenase (short-subunit alcohol dehydrogenase family)